MRRVAPRKAIYPFVSVLLHLALGYALLHYKIQNNFAPIVARNKPMQIETMGEKDYLQKLKDRYKKKPEQQLVQMDDRLKSELSPDKKQKTYLSKFNQVADQNMKAAHVGKFKNVLKEGVASNQKSTNQLKKLFELPNDLLKAQDKIESKTTTVASGRLRTPQPTRAPASIGPDGQGFSATDDYLKDEAIGAQTLLNTEEYKFYSFYARIREALSSQWSFRVRQELDQIYAAGKPLNGNEKTTKVEVLLDANGKLLHARVLSSSGFSELDRAAYEAFAAAAPFPHPPKDMIGPSSEVSIKWDFVVYAGEQGGVRIQVQRGGL